MRSAARAQRVTASRRVAVIAVAGVLVALSACSSAEPPDGALVAVAEAVPLGLPHEEDGPTVTDVEVGQATRLDLKEGEPETWCVAVDANASEPGHWLDGRSIWLAIENDDQSWRARPTFLIAVHNSWEDYCGLTAVAG